MTYVRFWSKFRDYWWLFQKYHHFWGPRDSWHPYTFHFKHLQTPLHGEHHPRWWVGISISHLSTLVRRRRAEEAGIMSGKDLGHPGDDAVLSLSVMPVSTVTVDLDLFNKDRCYRQEYSRVRETSVFGYILDGMIWSGHVNWCDSRGGNLRWAVIWDVAWDKQLQIMPKMEDWCVQLLYTIHSVTA